MDGDQRIAYVPKVHVYARTQSAEKLLPLVLDFQPGIRWKGCVFTVCLEHLVIGIERQCFLDAKAAQTLLVAHGRDVPGKGNQINGLSSEAESGQ